VQAGSSAKRLRPRVPAPPPGLPGGSEEVNLQALLPDVQDVVRIDERVSMRLPEPAPYLQVEVWEERTGLFNFASKGPAKKLLGQCYVPLEQKFNRRPCTWPIIGHGEHHGDSTDVGLLTCKFGLATSPLPVRGLRVVEGGTGSTEVCLAWEPPASDGGTPLRGYRVEAQPANAGAAAALAGLTIETPRTASAPPTPKPSVTMKNLNGNTAYTFRVWAVSEAGPGPSADILACTGPVAPGICGLPCPAGRDLASREAPLYVEWSPPVDTGGAAVVAYRMWLRPLFYNSLGNIYPSDGWIDLGLFEHGGEASDLQCAPIRLDALPSCSGCLCSIAALNAAGHTGPSTHEVPLFFEPRSPEPRDVWEVNSPDSGASQTNAWANEPGGLYPPSEFPVATDPYRLDGSASKVAPGNILREQVRAYHVQGQAWEELPHDAPPPRRASPVTSGSTEARSPLPEAGRTELYTQALRALSGGPLQQDGVNGVVQVRVARDTSDAMATLGGAKQGIRVEPLQVVNTGPAVSWQRGGGATYGLGAKGALVAGRPKPGVG